MTSRIDIIGSNGPDGRVYLVEKIARIMAGEHADMQLMGKNAGKVRWQVYVPTAIKILEEIENG
jgi:hypothetical protein